MMIQDQQVENLPSLTNHNPNPSPNPNKRCFRSSIMTPVSTKTTEFYTRLHDDRQTNVRLYLDGVGMYDTIF